MNTSQRQSMKGGLPQKSITKMNEYSTDIPIENVRNSSQESKYKYNDNY